MAKTFNLTIMAPENIIYEGPAVSLIVPAELGYLGILADHAPLGANLRRGTITLRKDSGQTVKFASGDKGFIEVLKNNVTILLNK